MADLSLTAGKKKRKVQRRKEALFLAAHAQLPHRCTISKRGLLKTSVVSLSVSARLKKFIVKCFPFLASVFFLADGASAALLLLTSECEGSLQLLAKEAR